MTASRHWKLMRVSAVALIPLTLWLISSVASLTASSYTEVHQWLSQPLTTALLTLFIITATSHATMGMQMVLEDYLNGDLFSRAFSAIRLLLLLSAVVSLFAIVRITFGSL